jgi:hypothetical protein
LGANGHVQIGAGHTQGVPGDLTQQTLEYWQRSACPYSSIGPSEHIGEVISLCADSHRVLSLLLLLLIFIETVLVVVGGCGSVEKVVSLNRWLAFLLWKTLVTIPGDLGTGGGQLLALGICAHLSSAPV